MSPLTISENCSHNFSVRIHHKHNTNYHNDLPNGGEHQSGQSSSVECPVDRFNGQNKPSNGGPCNDRIKQRASIILRYVLKNLVNWSHDAVRECDAERKASNRGRRFQTDCTKRRIIKQTCYNQRYFFNLL